MKPYFAKYLPVEGEVQERVKSLYAPSHKEYVAPTRLFLCSRDIQVGDKVINNQGAIIPWNEDMQILFETGVLLKDGLFKIIGEISPEAIWVKEGDEFDEEQLWYLLGGQSIRRPMKKFSMEKPEWRSNPRDVRIYLECPTCKKFH